MRARPPYTRLAASLLRLIACLTAVVSGVVVPSVVSPTTSAPAVFALRFDPEAAQVKSAHVNHTSAQRSAQQQANTRVVIAEVPNDIIPQNSNIWQCSCDTDGCWPGCFTIASASIAKYWAARGFPNLWNGDENGTLARLRELFPNLFCYNTVNGDGKPSDSGYEINDVVKGYRTFLSERGYEFNLTAIAEPTFEQVKAEIDAGRPIIGAFESSPWGSHAATIIGYDTGGGRQVMIVRPNLWHKIDTELDWGVGYAGFAMVTVVPAGLSALQNQAALNPPTQGPSSSLMPATTGVPTASLPIPQISYEMIVDDGEPAFTSSPNWALTYTVGYNDIARSTASTDPTNFGPNDDTEWARWTPDLPFDGIWDVLAYVPFTDTASGDGIASRFVTYKVNHAEGLNLLRRSQHDALAGWMSLGAFPFVRGAQGSVYLGNKTGDDDVRQVFADAMRFIWRGPLLIKSEMDERLYLVTNGKRHLIPDPETLGALRLNRNSARELSTLALSQYPEAEPVPSIFTSWVGQYFNNDALNYPATAVRGDTSLNFRWNGSAPAPGMGREFTARWTRIFALTEGEFVFNIESVGGLRLWVDGKLELDDWDSAGVLIQHEATIHATSGLHRVEVEYAARQGFAQIDFGNLPPNMPIVLQANTPTWTQVPTATLMWADAGDVDNTDKGRKFFVTVWRDDGVRQVGDVQTSWRATSEWMTSTEWTVTLPEDGKYWWSVVATDGQVNSEATPPRELLLDRTPPWAQMQLAQTKTVSQSEVQTAAIPQSYALQNIDGDLRGTEVLSTSNVQAMVLANPIDPNNPTSAPVFQPPFTVTGNLPAVKLTWWATDTLSGIDHVDVQAREVIRARTQYTISVSNQEGVKVGYQLVLSGGEEITETVMLPDVISYTTVVPVITYEPISPTEWVTVATNLRDTSTIFFGNPGSRYEFRVRAVDAAGNAQEWYEGYSAQAEIDPKTVLYKIYSAIIQK